MPPSASVAIVALERVLCELVEGIEDPCLACLETILAESMDRNHVWSAKVIQRHIGQRSGTKGLAADIINQRFPNTQMATAKVGYPGSSVVGWGRSLG